MTDNPDKPEAVTADAITPLDMPVPDAPAPADSKPAAVEVPAESAAVGETDSGGIVFDVLRHTHAKHPHTGRWMPRGGRKAKVKFDSPAGPPAASYIPPGELPPLPPEPAAEVPPKPAGPDHSEAAADCVARSAQFVAGLVLDAPDDCTPAAAEHASMCRAIAAYIRAKGWQFTGLLAVLVVFVAWLMRVAQKPVPAATIHKWFHGSAPKNVTPENNRPAKGFPAAKAAVIDLPPNIPPLARL